MLSLLCRGQSDCRTDVRGNRLSEQWKCPWNSADDFMFVDLHSFGYLDNYLERSTINYQPRVRSPVVEERYILYGHLSNTLLAIIYQMNESSDQVIEKERCHSNPAIDNHMNLVDAWTNTQPVLAVKRTEAVAREKKSQLVVFSITSPLFVMKTHVETAALPSAGVSQRFG